MSKHILYTWLGIIDCRASLGELPSGALGPIGQAVKEFDFEEIHILSDMDESANFAYSEWLSKLSSGNIVIHSCPLSSPMNFSEIYESVVRVIKKVTGGIRDGIEASSFNHTKKRLKNDKIVFHISPGTSAMATTWIILAKTAYPAELIQTSPENGVQIVSVPFDISAEFNPAMLFSKDDEILRISLGLPPKVAEFDDIIYRCAAMKKAVMRSRIVALHHMPVLLNGESGY